MRFVIPLVLFAVLVGFLAIGLGIDPKRVPSPLIDKPVPAFSAPTLSDPSKRLGRDDLLGEVWLLNVWGTWCVACRAEHETLNALARAMDAPIIGLNWKDDANLARQWLRQLGNPYRTVLSDEEGLVAIDFGVYGAPETFVVGRNGHIRHKFIGPITEEDVKMLLPMISRLQSETYTPEAVPGKAEDLPSAQDVGSGFGS